VTTRQCGECQLCCELLAVKERGHLPSGEPYAFNKPELQRCGNQCESGCAIYNEEFLPISCRAFECEWLLGQFRASDRPDRSGIVVSLRRDLRSGCVRACVYGVRLTVEGSDGRLDLRNSGASRTLEALRALPGLRWIQFMNTDIEPGVDLALVRTGRGPKAWTGGRVKSPLELEWVDGDAERELVRELFGDVDPPHRFRERLDNLSTEEQARMQERLDRVRGRPL
jgi:hypothetical protein